MLELAETVQEVSCIFASIALLSLIMRHFTLIFRIHILQLINPKVKIITVENTPDDPRQRKPDISKARELLGWEPKVKLREGLPLMEEDFRLRLGVPKN